MDTLACLDGFQGAAGRIFPVCQIAVYSYLEFRVRITRIKSDGLYPSVFDGCENVCSPHRSEFFYIVPIIYTRANHIKKSNHVAQWIVQVHRFVAVRRMSFVESQFTSNIGIIIGQIEKTVFTPTFSPAVFDNPRAVSRRLVTGAEFGPWIIIVPADN
jgi:hypothetical protein